MGKRILSVSYIEDTYQYLEVDKQAGGFFPQSPSPSTTVEALLSACRKADEIYVSATFPSALYEWETFPRVNKRYVPNLVRQNAKEKAGGAIAPQVQFKELGDVVEGGTTKSRISYIAVQREDLEPLWTTFAKFMRKVKVIAPLPVSLAATVARTEKPAENFMVVWVGEKSSVITISSSDGLVKMARSLPLGLARSASSDDDPGRLSDELATEIFRTSNFFKQEFREAPPRTVYYLGNNRLKGIFDEHPMVGAPEDARFGLSESPVKGMSDAQANEAVHLIGNLYLPDEFNFLSETAVGDQKNNLAFGLAAAAVIVLILGVGFWAFQLYNLQQDKVAERDRQMGQLAVLQKDVQSLRADADQLKPFAGWKKFYEDTFQNRAPWNMMLSELALTIPDNMVVEELKLLPIERGQSGPPMVTMMSGRVRADNWETGLADIRRFGGKLQASPLFDVVDVYYKPAELQQESKVFDFSMTLKLSPRGSAHES